jgi:hypothetical protein
LLKLRRRDLFILAALWLVAASLILGLTVWFLVSRPAGQAAFGSPAATPTPAPTYTVPFVEVTARRLYPAAEALARAWEPDIQLAGASARWPAATVDRLGDPTDWSFRFYSPARNRLYLVAVSGNGQAVGAEHFQKEAAPPPAISLEAWTVDSPEALARWLDNGGGARLSGSASVEVTMQLGVDPASGKPAWTITGLDDGGGQPLALKVDAATGQVSAWQP